MSCQQDSLTTFLVKFTSLLIKAKRERTRDVNRNIHTSFFPQVCICTWVLKGNIQSCFHHCKGKSHMSVCGRSSSVDKLTIFGNWKKKYAETNMNFSL